MIGFRIEGTGTDLITPAGSNESGPRFRRAAWRNLELALDAVHRCLDRVGSPFASGALECRELRWTYTPITALLPRHDVEMEVRRFLPTEDPVVLER